MTDQNQPPYGDPLTIPFWEAATRHELIIQHCLACGHYQFYPRSICLACQSDNLAWKQSAGQATIYAMSEVHIKVSPALEPPYVTAVIQLEEGPRMLTHIEGGLCQIGDPVEVTWRERGDAPPLPIFRPVKD